MLPPEGRFEKAITLIDFANSEDPHHETFQGRAHPKELLYAQRMSAWLQKLAPDAAEPVRLAVRCQHLCRWMIPRDHYPMERAGYLQWRKDLARFHAQKAGIILHDVGYDDETIARVQALVRKEHLKLDPETQLLEDVACLVFLENHFANFANQHDEEKLLTILRKTWAKMSPLGRDAALSLTLPAPARALLGKALAGPT